MVRTGDGIADNKRMAPAYKDENYA
jgi:hypothetical protein